MSSGNGKDAVEAQYEQAFKELDGVHKRLEAVKKRASGNGNGDENDERTTEEMVVCSPIPADEAAQLRDLLAALNADS